MTVLSLLGFKVPEYADDVHIPTYWAEMIAKLEELLLDGDGRVAFIPGDIKQSAQEEDHGRWLKLDGRELTQAQIETALDLEAGEGKAFADLMGLGAESKYGAAAAGKVKLADARRHFSMGAGPDGDGDNTFSARPMSEHGGAEAVKLTGAQSGVKAHGHALTDPGHIHAITDPGHAHGATQAAHTHGTPYAGFLIEAGPGGSTFQAGGGFSPAVIPNTLPAQPAITVANGKTGIGIVKTVTGITVNDAANTDATEAHPNVPPFVTLGYWFIRV